MNIVLFGAHPDDCEFFAGGTMVKWVQAGYNVLAVSLTNGDIGHATQGGGALARRRAEESVQAAERGGYRARTLDNHDGELTATLELRKEIVRIIREARADAVFSHRPNDYHPDHRHGATAVQDAAFMVTVPQFCPDTPRLERNPVFLYFMDEFTRPAPFRPDVAVDIGDVVETKWDLLDAMESQVYEWLPFLDNVLDEVPSDGPGRRAWLKQTWDGFMQDGARIGRAALEERYGPQYAANVRYAEAFEIGEYGRIPTESEIRELFPFFPPENPQ